MRTPKFHGTDVTISGHRSSPLKINKDSHSIHKSSSFSSSSHSHHQHGSISAAKRPPVIIYTQSPRIIHTQAHEFMTLVQKLTGLDRAAEEIEDPKPDPSVVTDEGSISNEDKDSAKNNMDHNNNNNYYIGYEDNESSGLTTDDSSPVSPIYKFSSMNNMNPYMIEASFLGSGSSDFMYSSSLPSPSVGSRPISPSFMDFVKGFSDY